MGTTITLGLAAMARGLADRTGLVTALPSFRDLPLPEPGDFVIGGHEIRRTTFGDSAEEFRQSSGVFDPGWMTACRDELAAASARVRPAPRLGLSPAIARLADWAEAKPPGTPRQAVDSIAADLDAFIAAESIDHLIVLNVASTEPPFPLGEVHQHWEALRPRLTQRANDLLPASSLFALAAIEGGIPTSTSPPAWAPRSRRPLSWPDRPARCYGGKDGKTGETLMKTVLAPMFAHRNLKVLSWVGHNIFGNRDGLVLDDPTNKTSKVETKDRVITEILGYKPSSIVTIEYLPDMGDWKTAWDHIHFQGFLGTKMTLQFTWQGCDSLLAAPLAIDLARPDRSRETAREQGTDAPPRLLLQEPGGRRRERLFQAVRQAHRALRSGQGTLMQLAFSTNAYLKHPFEEAADADQRRSATQGLELLADVPHAWPAGLLGRPEARDHGGDGPIRLAILEHQCVHDERDRRPSPAVLAPLVHRARPALPPGPHRPHPPRPFPAAPSWAPAHHHRAGRAAGARAVPPAGDRPVRRGPQAAGRARRCLRGPPADRARAGPLAGDDRPVPGGRRAR